MNPVFLRLFLIATLFFAQFNTRAFSATPPEIDHWFVDSLIKVFPEDAGFRNRLAPPEVLGARNSHVSIQWVLRSRQKVADVTVEVEGLASAAEAIAAQVRAVGYVVVSSNTYDTPPSEIIHPAPALFPDVLLEKFPITLEPEKTQPIWITLSIPADAKPGEYAGRLVLKVAGAEKAHEEFKLRVAAAMVPAQRTLKVTNWFYLSDRQLRSQYGVQQLTDDWWTVLGNIGRVMAEHRQNMISTPLTGFYFSKLALIGAHSGADGIEYDFANFDRWVDTFQKAGLIGSIEGSHVLRREDDPDDPAHLKVDVYVLEEGKAALKALPADDPRAEAGLRPMLVALRRHLEEKGWLGIYYQHILDEVGEKEMPVYRRYAAIVHEAMPGIRTMDAVDARRDLNIYEKSCDVWVPVLASFDDLVPRLHQHAQNGGEVWFYTCLFPSGEYANRFIDYALIKTRLLQWFNFRYDLPGFLHWGGNYWSPQPVLDTQPLLGEGWETSIIPAGDAFIVYPDKEHKSVLSSIRLEAMRESIEDYELLRGLEKQDANAAQALAKRAIPGFTTYVRDPAEFRKIHRQLLEDLSK
ncbi:MAG TPA: glycoside hydrolase domain-containing protein [Terriglobia bacterium]|nr:glycoside hydrolase domain-containing protein [Terriglobia bacterium]